jgi:deoxyribonuclease V
MSKRCTIACVDVAYGDTAAAVAGAVAQGWDAGSASQMLVRRFEGPPAGYEPGAFYRRELPLLLPVVAELATSIDVIIIDGYVWLEDDRLGLGGHLFASLGCRIPVIGVAKTRYRNDTWSIPVLRGTSRQALFVTSTGIQVTEAAHCVRRMHGDHRIPTILTLVDRAARDGLNRSG